MNEEQAYMETKAQEIGGSIVIIVPKHIANYLEIEKGSPIGILGKKNKSNQKHGSFWKIQKEVKP